MKEFLDFDDPKFLELAAQHDKERAKSITKKRKEIEPMLSVAELESRNREERLMQPLEANNKGRLMLQKLGYSDGQSLGLQERQGLIEPLVAVQRAKRRGLDDNENHVVAVRSTTAGVSSSSTAAEIGVFRDRKASSFKQKHEQILANKAFEIALTLDDAAAQVPLSKFANFAPTKLKQQQQTTLIESTSNNNNNSNKILSSTACCTTNINDDDEALTTTFDVVSETPTLIEAIEYLRKQYHYCLFCATRFKDADDLRANCPGELEDDHD